MFKLRLFSNYCVNGFSILKPKSVNYRSLNIRLSTKPIEYNGLVVERLNDKLVVELSDNDNIRLNSNIITCSQRSNLDSNAVVGDRVKFINSMSTGQFSVTDTGIITKIMERKNVLERPTPGSVGKRKITMKSIASNIDQIVIVVAGKPKVPLISVDQIIVGAICTGISNIAIVVNKIDLPESTKVFEQCEYYRSILGYQVLTVSVAESIGLHNLSELLSNKTSIFIGQSGVGKSSLINKLVPGGAARVGDLVERVEMGAHTTSNARLYHLSNNGNIVDSPGIREFGLWHYNVADVTAGFEEIFSAAQNCRFNDCKHDLKAKGCAVIEELKIGNISEWRMENYKKLLSTAST